MAAESLEREIRDLRALVFSERDPQGRGFAPLADALRRAGDLGQALELVEEGVARLPDFATGHVVSGWIHRARGDDGEAERAFRRVLELDEENVSALRGLGFLLADRGAEAEALEVFRRLDDLEPGDPEVLARLLELDTGGGAGEPASPPPPDLPGGPGAHVVPIASLAPEGGGRPLVDIRALAPTAGAEPDIPVGASGGPPVVDIADLAPEPPPDVPVVDVAALAPEAPPGGGSPDDAVVALPAPESGPATEVPVAGGAEGPWTRTMAELFVRQGLTDRAVRIYRRLVERSPGDGELRDRLRELEARADGGAPEVEASAEAEVYVPPAPEAGAGHVAGTARDAAGPDTAAPAPEEAATRVADDARLEDLARQMAAGPEMAEEPEGPFAWGGAPGPEEEPEEAPSGEAVSEYFASLLAWEPRRGGVRGGVGAEEEEGDGAGASPTPGAP